MDITAAEGCYNILYCYHICRSNYRKGMCYSCHPFFVVNLYIAQLSLMITIVYNLYKTQLSLMITIVYNLYIAQLSLMITIVYNLYVVQLSSVLLFCKLHKPLGGLNANQ